MGRVTSLRRFLLPLLVFIFAFSFGFLGKTVIDFLGPVFPEAERVSVAVESYVSWKYSQRFDAVQETFKIPALWGIFVLNVVTYSMNLWLGPFCFWITTFFEDEKTPWVIRGFVDGLSDWLRVKREKSYTELLFLFLAPLTLVFWLGFDGGLFTNLSFFFQPHAWLEFFVAFYAASIGLSLSEVSFKRGLKHFLLLVPLVLLAAVLEAPLVS